MIKNFFIVLTSVFLLTACGVAYNESDFANGGNEAPLYNERTAQFMNANNEYADIDSHKPIRGADMEAQNEKWNTSRMETHWQEYKGTMVRVQILLGDTDIREMRLRLMHNAEGMDVDGDARTILDKVADYEMKRVCGRNADNIVVIYDNPSFDVMRPTPYFDYRVESAGSTMREYGFRCVYNK